MARKPKKGKSSPLADYLRPAIDAKYKRRKKAAEDIGIDDAVLSKILSGTMPGVSEELIERICDKLGLDKSEGVLKLFLTKHKKVRKFFTKSYEPIPFKVIHSDNTINPKAISEAYTPVPVVPINDLAKTISLTHRASEHVLISTEFASKEGNIKCCQIKDDSMAPVLPDGSLIAVDLEDRKPQHGGLFLLNWKNEIMVRRVQIKDSYILFCPDNPDKDKYPIAVRPMGKVKYDWNNPIIGKVVWSMEKF